MERYKFSVGNKDQGTGFHSGFCDCHSLSFEQFAPVMMDPPHLSGFQLGLSSALPEMGSMLSPLSNSPFVPSSGSMYSSSPSLLGMNYYYSDNSNLSGYIHRSDTPMASSDASFPLDPTLQHQPLPYVPNYCPNQSYLHPSLHSNTYPPYISAQQPQISLSANSHAFVPNKRKIQSSTVDPNFTVDIEKVRRHEDPRTTLMIRNIPNNYSRDALVRILNKKCRNMYDFLYLPMDQESHCNMGYGYVNMIDLEAVCVLYDNYNNRRWPHTRSEKVCQICYGRLQSGSEDLIKYCSYWSVMTSDEKYHPLFFKPKIAILNGKEVRTMIPYKPHIDYSMRSN